MDKNYIVKKSNYFIMNTSYDLSLEEQKLILTLASMVQPEDEEFKSYNFKIADFMKLLGVDTKTKYIEIPKITKELMKKVFEIQEGNTLIQTAWLSGARYEKGSGMVTLKFNPDLKPYMLKLGTMFTQYKLANILSMKSKYSPRIYELLKCNEFKKQGYIEVEVDELRKMLKADTGSYLVYQNFRNRIILQTQKELKSKTDISFDFEEIKTGRKVTSLKFYIHSNKTKVNTKSKITKPINSVEDEIAATKERIEEDPTRTDEINYIKEVQNIFYMHNITEYAAKSLLKDANNDLELIRSRYEYSLTMNKVGNIVGYVRDLLKNFTEPQTSKKVSKFMAANSGKYNDEFMSDIESKFLDR